MSEIRKNKDLNALFEMLYKINRFSFIEMKKKLVEKLSAALEAHS